MKKISILLTVLCLFTVSFGSICSAKDTFQTSSDQVDSVAPLEKEYAITRLEDYDTGYTLARCYAPSDYSVQTYFFSSLSEEGECSIACPYQVVINALSPDGNVDMIYRSSMSYLYPPDPDNYFEEGVRFGTSMNTFIGYPMEMMMYPRTAQEMADHIVMGIVDENAAVQRISTLYVTDSEDPFLARQSKVRKDYYNMHSTFNALFQVTCDTVLTSYGDFTYYIDGPDQPLVVRMVLSTSMIHLMNTDYITGVTSDMCETEVPYYFFCACTPDAAEEAFADFDLFVANTRVTDEFVLMNQMESLMLNEIITQGWTQYDEDALWRSLGTGDGRFYEDRFSDYILDQNEYITSDGKSFKVPTSYDYVYEAADGEIYVSNTAEQPAGSTRLYAW